MFKQVAALFVFSFAVSGVAAEEARWPAPVAPAVPEADGYVVIPRAAVPPSRNHIYRAILESTQSSSDPKQILPALNMLGSVLNAMAAAGVPAKNVRFVVAFHGPAVNGPLLD